MADYLFTEAYALYTNEDWGMARVRFTEACRLYTILQGEDSSKVFTCELFIGKCLEKQAHYQVSLDTFMDLYKRCRQYYKEDYKAIIELEVHIGSCYAEMNQYENAIEFYRMLLPKVDESDKQYIECCIKACELHV